MGFHSKLKKGLYFLSIHLYSLIMINTYAESRLHKTLKNLYAADSQGMVEQEVAGKMG